MKTVIKKQKKIVKAYELGTGHPMEQKAIEEGKIRKRPDGSYELFSQEAKDGIGQQARPGDFFKLDSHEMPYPNDREWFFAHHTPLKGDEYLQENTPCLAWEDGGELGEEIRFLLDKERLTLHPDTPDRYFQAFLWNAPLSAPKDAVVIFYEVFRDETGKITDCNFNLVVRDIFQAEYRYCEDA